MKWILFIERHNKCRSVRVRVKVRRVFIRFSQSPIQSEIRRFFRHQFSLKSNRPLCAFPYAITALTCMSEESDFCCAGEWKIKDFERYQGPMWRCIWKNRKIFIRWPFFSSVPRTDIAAVWVRPMVDPNVSTLLLAIRLQTHPHSDHDTFLVKWTWYLNLP